MNGIHIAAQGTLGGDSELRFTGTGKPVLGFSIAVSESRANGDGAETHWLRCSAWDDAAEQLRDVLKRGMEVYIEGKLRPSQWRTADGEPRFGLNVSCWTVQPMGQIGQRAPRREPAEARA